MNVWELIGGVLDNPAIQELAAQVVAGFLKSKLPTVAEKDLADFLTRVAAKLGSA